MGLGVGRNCGERIYLLRRVVYLLQYEGLPVALMTPAETTLGQRLHHFRSISHSSFSADCQRVRRVRVWWVRVWWVGVWRVGVWWVGVWWVGVWWVGVWWVRVRWVRVRWVRVSVKVCE